MGTDGNLEGRDHTKASVLLRAAHRGVVASLARRERRRPYREAERPAGPRCGPGGLESLAELERSNEPLPKTTRARTGGGGIHPFLRYPADEEVRNSAGWLEPGLDVRGEEATLF